MSTPGHSFAAAPQLSRRFPGVLFSHNDLGAYLRKAADSHSLDCSGALLDNVKDAAFISDFISTHQFTFEYMNFGCCQLTPESLDYLLDKEVKHLRTFIIRDNNLKKAAGYVIAKLLGSRGRISTIDAQNNSLGDVGVSSIAGGFTSEMNVMKLRVPCPTLSLSKLTLRELDLSGNDITDLGVIALCSGLRAFVKNAHYADKSVSLKILRLSRNRITDKGAFSLAQLIDIGILSDIEDGANSSLLSPAGHEEERLPLHLEELCISDNLMTSIGLCNILIAASSLPMPLPMPDCDNDTDIESMRWREAELESVHCDDHNTRSTPSSSASSSATSSSSSSATASASPSPSRGTKVKEKVIGKGKAVMRRLEFARCNMTLETLGALSAFLSSSWTPSTALASHRTCNDMEDSIQIDFQFTDVQARKVLDCLAVKYESCGYRVGRSGTSNLTAIFNQLADVIKRNERVTKVLLGALPGVLAEWKASLTEDLTGNARGDGRGTGSGDGRGSGTGSGSVCLDVERDADMNKDSVDAGNLTSSSSRPKTSRISRLTRPTELPVRSHRAAAALLEDISGALTELSSITHIIEPPYLRPSSSHTAAQEDIVATRDRRNNSKNKNNSNSNKDGNNDHYEAIAKSRQVQQLNDNRTEVSHDCAIDPVDCSRAGRAAGRSAHTTCEREDDWDWDSTWNTSIDYTSMPQLDKLDLNQGQQQVDGQEQGQGLEQEEEQKIKGDEEYCDTHSRHRHGQGSMGEERGTREDTRTARSHSIDESLTSSAINVEAFTLSAGNRVSHGSQDRYRESCTSSLQTSPQGPPRMPYDVTHMPYDVTHMPYNVTHMPYDVTHMPYDVTHMRYDVTHTAGDSNRQSGRLGADESSMGSPSFSSRVYSAFMTELPDDVEAYRETSHGKIDFDYMKDDSCAVDGWAVSRDNQDDVEKSSAEAVVGLEGKGKEEVEGKGEEGVEGEGEVPGVSRGRVGGAEGRPSTSHEEERERRGKVYNQRTPGPCRRERSRERVAQQLSLGSIGKQSCVRERHGREPADTECVTATHSSHTGGAGDGSTHTKRSSVNISRDRGRGKEVEHSRASAEKREMAVERVEDRSSHSSSSLSSAYHDSRRGEDTDVLRVSLPSRHQDIFEASVYEVNDIDKMKRNCVRERLEVKGRRGTGTGSGAGAGGGTGAGTGSGVGSASASPRQSEPSSTSVSATAEAAAAWETKTPCNPIGSDPTQGSTISRSESGSRSGSSPSPSRSPAVSVSMSMSMESDMQCVVQRAVDEALHKAQRQWLSALAPVLLSMRSSGTSVNSNRSSQNSDTKFRRSRSSSRNRGDRGDENGVSSRSSSVSKRHRNRNSNSNSNSHSHSNSTTSNNDRLDKIKRDSSYDDARGSDLTPSRPPGTPQVPLGPSSLTRDAPASVCGTPSSRSSLFQSGSGSGVRTSGVVPGEVEKEGEKEQRRDKQSTTDSHVRDSRRISGTVTENQSTVAAHDDEESDDLSQRLIALESDIEFEHEASMKVLEALLSEHYKLSLQQKNSQTASQEYRAIMASRSSSHSPSSSPRHAQNGSGSGSGSGNGGGSSRERHMGRERGSGHDQIRGNNRDWLTSNNASPHAPPPSPPPPPAPTHTRSPKNSRTLDLANSYPQSDSASGGGMLGTGRNCTGGHAARIGNTSRSYSQPHLSYPTPNPSYSPSPGPGPAPSYTVPRQASHRALDSSIGSRGSTGGGSVSDRGAYLRNSMQRMNTYVRPTRSSILKASHQQTLYRDPKDREGPQWAPNGTGSLSRDSGSISRSRIRLRETPSLEDTLSISMGGLGTGCEADKIWGPFPPPLSARKNRIER